MVRLQAVQLRRRARCPRSCRRSSTWARRSPTSVRTRSRPPTVRRSWIYDFGLQADAANTERVRDLFQDTFLGVWRGELEDDALNGLVLGAHPDRTPGVDHPRDRQVPAPGAASASPTRYIGADAARRMPRSRLLVGLFDARFDPDARDDDAAERLGKEIEEAIDAVASLDEDRILRSFLAWCARSSAPTTSRPTPRATPTPYLSFKLDPAQIPMLPLPRPRFEIFVYSPRVEGVHLRGGRVARGGLRWSDRREDFRTEVLGLMKAQMVKNAVIVPVGAKGGFVVKRPPAGRRPRGAPRRRAIACYKAFLSGLLDITDNIVDGEVVPPAPRGPLRRRRPVPGRRRRQGHRHLLRHRQRGLAELRLLARRRVRVGRLERLRPQGRWGSPRAARGSRSSAISASSAPTSRRPTSRWSGSATCRATCSATGCCCSRHIRLVAAFNHMHVFLDPDPDPETSFDERKRLFELPRSAWSDYDASLISAGGGVFSRSRQVDRALPSRSRESLGDRRRASSPPDELIRAILRGAGRPALERRHRHLRQGRDRDPRGRRRQGQRRGARRRPRAALPGRRRGRQPRPDAARRGSSTRSRGGPRSTPTRSTTSAGVNMLRPRGQHQDPARRAGRRRRPDREAAQRAAGGDDRRGRRSVVLRDSYTQTQALEPRR